MIDKVNHGDKEALRSFLQTYAKHIMDRAALRLHNEHYVHEAVRLTMLSITEAAQRGEVPMDALTWIDTLCDESCKRLSMPLNDTATPAAPKAPVQAEQAPQPSAQPAARPTPKDAPDFSVPAIPKAQSAKPVGRPAQRHTAPPVQQTQNASRPQMQAAPVQQAQNANRPQAAPVQQAQDAKRPQAQAAPAQQTRRPQPQPPAQQAQSAKRPQTQQPVQQAQSVKRPQRGESVVPPLFEKEESGAREERIAKPEKKAKGPGVGLVFIVFILVLVVLGLIWMLLVMLMQRGYLPMMDFGFAQWFNANVFHLF